MNEEQRQGQYIQMEQIEITPGHNPDIIQQMKLAQKGSLRRTTKNIQETRYSGNEYFTLQDTQRACEMASHQTINELQRKYNLNLTMLFNSPIIIKKLENEYDQNHLFTAELKNQLVQEVINQTQQQMAVKYGLNLNYGLQQPHQRNYQQRQRDREQRRREQLQRQRDQRQQQLQQHQEDDQRERDCIKKCCKCCCVIALIIVLIYLYFASKGSS